MGAAVGIPAEFEQLTAEQKVSLETKYAEQKEGGKTDEEIIAALTAETTANGSPIPGDFAKGKGVDCTVCNPDNYKVVAEIPGARLIEMTMDAGMEDTPHDHPIHYMYVVESSKLQITDASGVHEAEPPAGAAPIFPAGPHQVKNIGEGRAKIIFVEPLPDIKPIADLPGFISPFDVYAEGYTKLGEDDDWIIGKMNLGDGKKDVPHSHNDHLCYVLEGEAISIFPLPDITVPGAFAETMKVPISAGMALPVPAGHHVVEAPGKGCTIIFFERKR